MLLMLEPICLTPPNKRIKAIVELNQSEEWNGSMHSWYKNGAYLGCAGLENGQHIGISIAYHRNGNLRAVANFDNGLPVGLEYQFDQLGELRSTKKHGLVSRDGKTKKFDH